ncbi:hypothetical protein Glove_66g63 [Diversispora epigaea]|uniref:Protein kinase domain-containing protein n=1 Tax=Diversispora epigaea TaxID=1348612 RepID=A0A397JAI2_9GLOM|nr:hypothetical protein Glove_66g63 [Diversispora epigaea]
MKGMRKTEEIKDTGETEEMKGTRKREEMKDIGETKELEESEILEEYAILSGSSRCWYLASKGFIEKYVFSCQEASIKSSGGVQSVVRWAEYGFSMCWDLGRDRGVGVEKRIDILYSVWLQGLGSEVEIVSVNLRRPFGESERFTLGGRLNGSIRAYNSLINYHKLVNINSIKGTCNECHQNNTGFNWCNPCNAKQFQNEFGKWTSEDREIDNFIQQIQLNANKYQEIIEWIPFEKLENITYLAKGGFGTAYKAKWLDGFIKSWNYKIKIWRRPGGQNVCLKSLDNSTNKIDFLQEIKNQLKFRGKNAIAIYGITKNPTKNEYMMVMDYAEYGSLRNLLNNKFEILTWKRKHTILSEVVKGLKNIHEMGLMHKDFHSGNIINPNLALSYITDFGLCKPVTENDPENIYGVIPYMAPETLSRGEYTKASDIYSFGMVMLEVLTSYPPYYNIPHNENLAMGICEGLKPEIKCEIPQFLKEIMEKCWNFEPLNRPTAEELGSQLQKHHSFDDEIRKHVNTQVQEANKSNKNFIQYHPNVKHSEAIYTSRHLPFVKSKKFETHDTKQWDFVIPDDINDIIEENEIQEN